MSITPGWLSVRRGQRLVITVANLNENDSPRIRVQGQVCSCQVLPLKGNMRNVVCTSPELIPNSTSAVVELASGSSVDSKTLTLVRPLMRIDSVGSSSGRAVFQPEISYQRGLSHLVNTPFVLSPFQEKYRLSSHHSAVSFENTVMFDVLYPGEIFDSPSDFDLQLKANSRNRCPNEYAESCGLFVSQYIAVTNITVLVSTRDILRASGTVSIFRCPLVLCGSGGRGLLFDGNFSIKQRKYAEQPAVLSIVPVNSQPVISVRPAIVPAGRSFSIAVHVNRFSMVEAHKTFQCDFVDKDGKISNGIVGNVKQDEGGDLLEILLFVPGLALGAISGRIFSEEPSIYRSQTINTFNILSSQDPAGPCLVDWISSTQGPYTGSLVQARLVGFPMMNSTTDVRSDINVFNPFVMDYVWSMFTPDITDMNL
jgi:hypothetical protein